MARTVGDAQVVEAAGVVRVVAARCLERLERSLPVAITVALDALLPVLRRRVVRVVDRVRVVARVGVQAAAVIAVVFFFVVVPVVVLRAGGRRSLMSAEQNAREYVERETARGGAALAGSAHPEILGTGHGQHGQASDGAEGNNQRQVLHQRRVGARRLALESLLEGASLFVWHIRTDRSMKDRQTSQSSPAKPARAVLRGQRARGGARGSLGLRLGAT